MTTPSENSVEVDFDPMEGVLRLSCGPIAFARLRDAILAELGEESDIRRGDIQVIGIESIPKTEYRPIWGWLFSIGCWLAGAPAALVFVVGLITLVAWISSLF